MKPGCLAIAAGLLFSLPMTSVTAQTQDSVLERIDFKQKLNGSLPLDSQFTDSEGSPVRLSDIFRGKPVILAMVYYECPMLCTLVMNGMLKALNVLDMHVGDEFDTVFISIDPSEEPSLAKAKKQNVMSGYAGEKIPAGWHFLTGTRENIDKVAEAIGFEYVYDEEINQYAHASGFTVNTPQGKISRYFLGIEYSARDLKLALMESSEEKIGSLVDQILLFCYHYDPTVGKYGLAINRIMRIFGSLTALALFGAIGWFLYNERKRKFTKS